eukprot:6270303-Prymnesium_polylepis.1
MQDEEHAHVRAKILDGRDERLRGMLRVRVRDEHGPQRARGGIVAPTNITAGMRQVEHPHLQRRSLGL